MSFSVTFFCNWSKWRENAVWPQAVERLHYTSNASLGFTVIIRSKDTHQGNVILNPF